MTQQDKEAEKLFFERVAGVMLIILCFILILLAGCLLQRHFQKKTYLALKQEIAEKQEIVDNMELLVYEGFDMERRDSDIGYLQGVSQKLFQFKTADEFYNAKQYAENIGLSADDVKKLYADDMLFDGMTNTVNDINCTMTDSEFMLTEAEDGIYHYIGKLELSTYNALQYAGTVRVIMDVKTDTAQKLTELHIGLLKG